MLELKPQNSGPWVISINRDDLDSTKVFSHNPGQGVGWVFEHCPYFYNSGSYNKFLTTADEGSGNGLDADSVDGVHASAILRSDVADTASGDITFSGGAGAVTVSAGSDIRIAGGTWTGEYTGGIKIQPDANNAYIQYHGTLFFRDEGSTNNFQLNQSGNATFTGSVTATGGFSGSGANLSNLPSQTDQNFTTALKNKLDGIEASATADQTASEIVSLVNNQAITPSSFTCSSTSRINARLGVGGPATHANLCSRTSGTDSIPTGGLIQNNVDSHGLQVWNTSNSANYTGIMLETRTTGAAGWLIGCEHQSNFNGDLFFRGRNGGTSSFEAFRITSSKNCGIGDTSPDSTLCVKGTTHTNFQVKSGNSSTKLFGQTIQGGEVRFGTSTNSHLDIYTNGTRRFRYENGGNLHYTLNGSNTIRFDQTTTANNRFQNIQYSRSGNGRGDVSQIQIGEGNSSEGRINIKTSPPNANHSGGVFISNGGTSFGSLSDIRLKTKVADISNALSDIAKIDTWKYTWNSDTSSTVHLGITAQSVKEVYPEVVEQTNTMNDDPENTTEYLAVLHQELIPVCIAAIKELKSKVEELQSEVASLKAS